MFYLVHSVCARRENFKSHAHVFIQSCISCKLVDVSHNTSCIGFKKIYNDKPKLSLATLTVMLVLILVIVTSKKEKKPLETSGQVTARYSLLQMLLPVVWTLTMLNML